MIRTSNTVNAISSIFCEATKEVLEASTGKEITYAKTIQKIPAIHLRPEIGCFVLFSGDYSGLMIINFSSEAAMSIYRSSMMFMGLPEDELCLEYTADEVVDNIGEMINQIIGKVRRGVEMQYGLVSSNTQPKAIALTTSIILTIDAQEVDKELCRRLSFKVDGHSFHIELSLEKTEFISLDGSDIHARAKVPKREVTNVNLDDYMAEAQAAVDEEKKADAAAQQPAAPSQPSEFDNGALDFEALLKANK
ncbi:MAG: chemotaxis protein CheC [SAR324 cluster bacterium]|uniref:Chemotaxis protein CheC n=1 Tax=SAR324 cluster bacterium TaxID=2024889 RepID=A0A2A4T8C8_9DELT|nr:MAG: chemotaxis protein CheC [SAR324 cluster bacterium]